MTEWRGQSKRQPLADGRKPIAKRHLPLIPPLSACGHAQVDVKEGEDLMQNADCKMKNEAAYEEGK